MRQDDRLKALNQGFDSFLDSILFDVVDTEFTEKKKHERRRLADHDDLTFAKTYFPQIFTLGWNEAHRWVASLALGKYTLSGFPKSGKSAIVYVTKAIKPLVMGVGGLVNVNAAKLDTSIERTASLVRLITRNRLLCYDYDVEVQQAIKGNYIINNTYLVAGSKSTGLRNLVDDNFKRIRFQINDDLYDKTSVTSELDNERVVDFVTSEAWRQLEDEALSITMGNAISGTCPIVKLQAINPANHFSLPALDENGQSTWPEYKTTEEWNAFQLTIPWDLWEGEFMNRPCLRGELFNPDWLIEAPAVHLPPKEGVTLAVADLATGSSPDACFKSITTGTRVNPHLLVVRDQYLRKEPYVSFFDYAWALRQRIPFMALMMEADFGQYNIASDYYKFWRARPENKDKSLPLVPYYAKNLRTPDHGADKMGRFMNLMFPFQHNEIMFDPAVMTTKDHERFRAQYQAIGAIGAKGEKVDGMDSLAALWILSEAYQTTGSFSTQKLTSRIHTGVKGFFDRGGFFAR